MIVSFTLTTLWHERQRFLSGMLAVAFSAVLINLQCGLLLGLFATTSAPIDHAAADIWVGAPRTLSVDLGRPISETHLSRLAHQPGVERPEIYLLDYGYWVKKDGSKELCIVIGSRLTEGSLGAVEQLTPQLRARLSEPGSVVIDASELGRLGVRGINDVAEINGRRARVVGIVDGLKSLTGPYIFCSLDSARQFVPVLPEQTTYLLARCPQGNAAEVAERIRGRHELSALTREEFSLRTRLYWLTMTNAGISALFTAALGLLVGAVVTSQTLYAATVASLKEYAVLRALGIPRWRIGSAVLALAFCIGVIGVLVALPIVYMLGHSARVAGTQMLLSWWLLLSGSAVTLIMAMLSGLAALRSLRLVEPATLLH